MPWLHSTIVRTDKRYNILRRKKNNQICKHNNNNHTNSICFEWRRISFFFFAFLFYSSKSIVNRRKHSLSTCSPILVQFSWIFDDWNIIIQQKYSFLCCLQQSKIVFSLSLSIYTLTRLFDVSLMLSYFAMNKWKKEKIQHNMTQRSLFTLLPPLANSQRHFD